MTNSTADIHVSVDIQTGVSVEVQTGVSGDIQADVFFTITATEVGALSSDICQQICRSLHAVFPSLLKRHIYI